MDIQSTILKFVVFFIPILSVSYIVIGVKLFRQKGKAQVNYFSMLMFACAIYSFGYFLELNCLTFDALIVVRNFEFFGSVFIPTFGMLFVAQLTAMKVTKKAVGVLSTISIILWIVFITNSLHGLIYKSLELEVIQGFAVPITEKGPAFYSMMVYYALLLIFSSVALVKAHQSSEKKKDKSSFRFMFITFQIPWVAMMIILLGFDKYVDPTQLRLWSSVYYS